MYDENELQRKKCHVQKYKHINFDVFQVNSSWLYETPTFSFMLFALSNPNNVEELSAFFFFTNSWIFIYLFII